MRHNSHCETSTVVRAIGTCWRPTKLSTCQVQATPAPTPTPARLSMRLRLAGLTGGAVWLDLCARHRNVAKCKKCLHREEERERREGDGALVHAATPSLRCRWCCRICLSLSRRLVAIAGLHLEAEPRQVTHMQRQLIQFPLVQHMKLAWWGGGCLAKCARLIGNAIGFIELQTLAQAQAQAL